MGSAAPVPAGRTQPLRLFLYFLTGAFLSAAALVAFGRLPEGGPPEAPGPGVAPAPAAPAGERRLLPVPVFKQWDPAWGDDRLGGSGERLRFAGCTVTCVAMVFRHYGLDTDPGRLNAWLRGHEGYTAQGLLRWEKCVEYSGGRVAVDYLGDPDEARMRRALAAGRPAIVKVMLEGGVNHWVLVVGTEGQEPLVHDPLNLSPAPARLADYGPRTYALRIFRKLR